MTYPKNTAGSGNSMSICPRSIRHPPGVESVSKSIRNPSGAEEVADVVKVEIKPPAEVDFLTVWHFFKACQTRPMVALPLGPNVLLNPREETCSVLVYSQPVCI